MFDGGDPAVLSSRGNSGELHAMGGSLKLLVHHQNQQYLKHRRFTGVKMSVKFIFGLFVFVCHVL